MSRSEGPHASGRPHSSLEDIYALIVGLTFIVIGLVLLKTAGLVTGGIAGIALLVSYVLPLPVGVIFTLINVPFFIFAYFAMGRQFALRTIAVNLGVTGLLSVIPTAMRFEFVHPAFAALAGGTLCGMGVLALARHGAGVGGTGVVTLWLQKKRGLNAGRSQIMIDVAILLVSFSVIAPDRLAWSALSALSMSCMVIAWHRPGRYIGY
ncbi:YitT family protein [Actimicrobium antarcticum]|uniref:YitT family protein n=1 Tax=Actimicrobium antarcticum TaxID=1051899 RepID=A0ABP7TI29_9BURK